MADIANDRLSAGVPRAQQGAMPPRRCGSGMGSNGLARWLPTPLCACQSLGNGRAIPLPEITDLPLSAALALPAEAYNPWRAGFGAPSRLFDLGTFDWIRRRSIRQFIGESLPLCRRSTDRTEALMQTSYVRHDHRQRHRYCSRLCAR
jgi:hypothetical protein